MKIGFIGAGNMAEAIIKGIIATGKSDCGSIFVSDVSKDRLQYISQVYQVKTFRDNKDLIGNVDIIILAVKPQSVDAALQSIAIDYPPQLPIISIAAGIDVAKITDTLGDIPVIRVMPNTPSLVGAGAAGIYVNKKAREYIDRVVSLFSSIGEVVLLKKEEHIDIVTALSGSGPAYYFLLMEEMIRGAVELGLDAQTASKLTLQTAYGAAKLALEAAKEDESPEQLRKKVTSPGGTTEAAIKVFNEDQFGAIVVLAMQKAKERSKELSGR